MAGHAVHAQPVQIVVALGEHLEDLGDGAFSARWPCGNEKGFGGGNDGAVCCPASKMSTVAAAVTLDLTLAVFMAVDATEAVVSMTRSSGSASSPEA